MLIWGIHCLSSKSFGGELFASILSEIFFFLFIFLYRFIEILNSYRNFYAGARLIFRAYSWVVSVSSELSHWKGNEKVVIKYTKINKNILIINKIVMYFFNLFFFCGGVEKSSLRQNIKRETLKMRKTQTKRLL